MKPSVGLDVDGVLGQFTEALMRKAGVKMPMPDPRSITTFPFKEHLTKAQYDHAIDVLRTPGFAADVDVMPGAQLAVDAIRRNGCEIVIITSPWVSNPQWEFDRRGWLEKHFDIPEEAIISTTQKWRCDVDVFVDDRPKHVESWSKHFRRGAFLFDQPHNMSAPPAVNVARIATWSSTVVDNVCAAAHAVARGRELAR